MIFLIQFANILDKPMEITDSIFIGLWYFYMLKSKQ